MNKKVFVFGDSIAWGAWDTEGGWVTRLKKDIDERIIPSNFDYYIELYNLSVSGNTSHDVVKRFTTEISARSSLNGEEITIIFAIGINDTLVHTVDKTNRVGLAQFKKNIVELYQLAQNITPEIIFVGLTPIDENVINTEPWMEHMAFLNQEISSYNNYIETFCEEQKILFINVLSHFSDYKNLLSDGLHPNKEGHHKMHKIIKELLVSNSII